MPRVFAEDLGPRSPGLWRIVDPQMSIPDFPSADLLGKEEVSPEAGIVADTRTHQPTPSILEDRRPVLYIIRPGRLVGPSQPESSQQKATISRLVQNHNDPILS